MLCRTSSLDNNNEGFDFAKNISNLGSKSILPILQCTDRPGNISTKIFNLLVRALTLHSYAHIKGDKCKGAFLNYEDKIIM